MSGETWNLTVAAETWTLRDDPSIVYQVVAGVTGSSGGGGVSLGETASTAYRGDRGKTAYDHSLIAAGNPHAVTKHDVGLGSVDNTADASKTFDASQVVTGVLATGRIPALDASKITTGSIDPARVPNLDAGKITTGVLPIARIASGVPDGTKFVRDDGTLATVTAGGSEGYSTAFLLGGM